MAGASTCFLFLCTVFRRYTVGYIPCSSQAPIREQPRRRLAQIVKIGFPSAFETALYNVAMTFIVRFMNQMDTDG